MQGVIIHELADDELIGQPGFYRMSLERHHSQPCQGISVTSSVLRRLELASPADVWAYSKLNPNAYQPKDRSALIMGQAMASFIEGGLQEMARKFYQLPADKPNRPTSAQLAAIDAGKGTEAGIRSAVFWARVEADHRQVLTADEWDLIAAMGEVVRIDPAAQVALGGEPEITMAWFDAATRLWCLSRPDQTAFSGMLSDYKKINTQGRPFTGALCDTKITGYLYDAQMAFAAEGFEILTGGWPEQVGLVFQQDEPPYSVILRAIDEEDLRLAMFRNARARRKFRACLDANHWPGPGEHVGAYQRPEWQRERLLKEMQMEGLAP